jgi:hypothetical protein
MDTVVCLTLAKWETVSGRFGGYLTTLAADPIHARHETEKPATDRNCRSRPRTRPGLAACNSQHIA